MPASRYYKKIFLLDGTGAVITALLLSQVLARYEPVFGMPRGILFVLAGIAGCFAVYSLLCYFLVGKNWQAYLKGIAAANALYCVATLGLVLYLHASLTWLGIAYFVVEMAIVLGLAGLELKIANKKHDRSGENNRQ